MVEHDFDDFQALLNATCSLLSRGKYEPNSMNTAMFFRSLAQYDIATVREGFDAHMRDHARGRFTPLPADILAQIEGKGDGRPDEEEAWAIALRSTDEQTTVVWTQEIAQAIQEVKVVLAAGDRVGARMSFKAVYTRLVADARKAQVEIEWSASLGRDKSARNAALLHHVKSGRISADLLEHSPVDTHLLMLELEKPVEVKALPGNPELAEQLRKDAEIAKQKLRDYLKEPRGERQLNKADAEAKERTAALKAQTAERVRQLQEQDLRGAA